MAAICWFPLALTGLYLGTLYVFPVRKVVFHACVVLTFTLTHLVLFRVPRNCYGDRYRTLHIGPLCVQGMHETCTRFDGITKMTHYYEFFAEWGHRRQLTLRVGPRRFFTWYYSPNHRTCYGTKHTWI